MEVTGKAGESIQRIIREADKVGMMVAQIASSATQQATATEQVTTSMGQISELAIESADGSQLSARSCEQLLRPGAGTAEHGGPVRRGPARDEGGEGHSEGEDGDAA